ncbi:hypothetical protein [Mesorhizobium sp. IMUNJ 23232]|uniref:hypothetical protein n=1 Tax=Mesorhizobium sp. IMUNJ 23232 TaxID=3376064 RepID=UPI00379F5983
MDFVEIPRITTDLTLQDALQAMTRGGRSALLVDFAGSAKVIDADTLVEAIRGGQNKTISEVSPSYETVRLEGDDGSGAAIATVRDFTEAEKVLADAHAAFAVLTISHYGETALILTDAESRAGPLRAGASVHVCRKNKTHAWYTYQLRKGRCPTDNSQVDP